MKAISQSPNPPPAVQEAKPNFPIATLEEFRIKEGILAKNLT
jgi:hypothetical protein